MTAKRHSFALFAMLVSVCVALPSVVWAAEAAAAPDLGSGPYYGPTNEDVLRAQAFIDRGDFANAIQILVPLVEQGDADAEVTLGYLYADGLGVARDPAVALRFYQLAAEQGGARAMNLLGFAYHHLPPPYGDFEQARHWYEEAAEMNWLPAVNNLGLLYMEGSGVEQDYAEARRATILV